ncbi:hypothetical protein ACE6H2_005901 [Prunus campanulata]
MEDMNGENNYRDDDGTQASPKLIFETGVDFNAFADSESNKEKLSKTIQVRGIKTKTKVVGNSKRPKNALEKLTKKKKPRNKEECALLEHEPDSHNETIHMPTQSQATMDISQAELPQEEELSLLSSELTCNAKTHDMDIQDVK